MLATSLTTQKNLDRGELQERYHRKSKLTLIYKKTLILKIGP